MLIEKPVIKKKQLINEYNLKQKLKNTNDVYSFVSKKYNFETYVSVVYSCTGKTEVDVIETDENNENVLFMVFNTEFWGNEIPYFIFAKDRKFKYSIKSLESNIRFELKIKVYRID